MKSVYRAEKPNNTLPLNTEQLFSSNILTVGHRKLYRHINCNLRQGLVFKVPSHDVLSATRGRGQP